MDKKIKSLVLSFLPCRMRRQMRELYSATIILNFAMAMVAVFEPVFLFVLFSKNHNLKASLELVLVFYLAVYAIYFFCVPLGGKLAKKLGYENSIAIGTFFTALFYLCLFGSAKYIFLLVPAVIIYVLWKMFYWPAYYADFATFSVGKELGRELSDLSVLQSLVAVAGPIIGGVILQFLGFKALFVLVAVIMVISNVPMLITKEKVSPEPFSYLECFKRLFAKSNFRRLVAFCGFGEEFIVLMVWPIFVYLAVNDFFGLGVITAIATLITLLIYLYIGKLTDQENHGKVMRMGAVIYFFVWIFRTLSNSVLAVLSLDTASKIAKQAIAVPMIATVYEEAQRDSVMPRVVFFEMGLVVGKILAMIIGLILLQFFNPGWNALFILAGAMSLLYLFF